MTDSEIADLRKLLDAIGDVQPWSQNWEWVNRTRRLLALTDQLRADLSALTAAREKDKEDTLSTFQCGFFLKVAPRTVSKWCDTDKLKHRREPVTNNRLISVDDLVAFMRENGMEVPEVLTAE